MVEGDASSSFDRDMSVVQFKLTHKGKSYRFSPSGCKEKVSQEINDYVTKIVDGQAFKLYWNDGESKVLLESPDELLTAINFAMSRSTKPTCVRLTVEETRTTAGEGQAQQVEDTADATSTLDEATVLPVVATEKFVYASAETNTSYAEKELCQLQQVHDAARAAADAVASRQQADERLQQGIEARQGFAAAGAAAASAAAASTASSHEAEQLLANAGVRSVISSFRAEENGNECILTLSFNCPLDFTLWKEWIKAALAQFELRELFRACLSLSTHDKKLTVTMQNMEFYWLIKLLRPLALRTEFQHVQVDDSELITDCSDLFVEDSILEVTIDQKPFELDDSADYDYDDVQFDPWLEFVRCLRPAKVRVNRLVNRRERTRELVDFLEEAVQFTEVTVIPSLVAQEKPRRNLSNIYTDKEIIGEDHLAALLKFNADVKANKSLHLVVSSFRSENKGNRTTMTFNIDRDCMRSTELWHEGLRAALSALDLPHCLASLLSYLWTVTVPTAKADLLIALLRPLARKTEFKQVQIDETPKMLRNFADFFCSTSVRELTIRQKNNVQDQFTHWLEFVRIVRPAKVGVCRLETTSELVSFLMQTSEHVKSIWLGGRHCQSALPLSLIKEIFTSGNCKYLHIADSITRASAADVLDLVKFFQTLGNKVSLAIRTDIIRSMKYRTGDYSVKKCLGRKYNCDERLIFIEHVEMHPKQADKCC